MNWFDAIRFLIFAAFGIGLGFMFLANILAFWVLRPPKRLGFLWWHVTSISLSFLCIGIVATERVVGRLGNPPSWRTFVTLIGMVLFAVAQTIIFTVERKRFINSKARTVAIEASPPGTYTES